MSRIDKTSITVTRGQHEKIKAAVQRGEPVSCDRRGVEIVRVVHAARNLDDLV